MNKPIIGIFSNVKISYDQTSVPKEEIFVLEKYINAIEKNGGISLIIHSLSDFESNKRLIDMCDGLLFQGGNDIDPKLYGENPHKKLGPIIPKLDKAWYTYAKYAIENKIPTLGICKGMQLLNIAAGGTLYQDIEDQIEDSFQHVQLQNRDNLIHRVHIDKDCKLNTILGIDSIFTNTIHHQSIKDVGEGFKATAFTEDGIIEAIESNDGLIIGVQWHPEELLINEVRMNYIFENLCLSCLDKVKN